MEIKMELGGNTEYQIQGLWSEQGEEPDWKGINSFLDRGDALVEYQQLVHNSKINVPLRLISKNVRIDVLEETNG